MKVVFVSGPFSADTKAGCEANIVRSEQLGFEVGAAGAAPIVPNSIGRTWDGVPSYEFWIEATKEILRRCDALITVPGWEKSSGARGEVALAKELGIPVFHSIENLKAWLKYA
jgi:hypothetical protein